MGLHRIKHVPPVEKFLAIWHRLVPFVSEIGALFQKLQKGMTTGIGLDPVRVRQIDFQPQFLHIERLCKKLNATTDGLSVGEAAERLAIDGANLLAEPQSKSWMRRVSPHIMNPFALLLWTGAVFAGLGESFSPGEGMALVAGALIVVVILNGSFSFWQEIRVEQAMAAFAGILSPQARVIREGTEAQIEASQVVVGDVIVLRKGDRVPADARLFACQGLKVDNSILTGESEPQLRTSLPVRAPRLSARNLLLSGTLVTSGTGHGLVYATGNNTEIGRIAATTREIKRVDSPIKRELQHFVRVITAIAVILGICFFFMGWALGNPFWTNLVFAIGIIVANVPEGLLPTVTMALAISGRRMARRNALLKTLESAETLGSTTVICTDKTGTITQNKMRVTDLILSFGQADDSVEADKECVSLAQHIMVLCNNAVKSHEKQMDSYLGDPTEVALLAFADELNPNSVDVLRQQHTRIYERPFDSMTKEMATVHQLIPDDSSQQLIVDLKGAPEVVIGQCSHILQSHENRPLTQEVRLRVMSITKAYAKQGKRVLALARKTVGATQPPSGFSEADEILEGICTKADFCFCGLVAMRDPPRPEVYDAIRLCRQAGIRVIIISGDHPETVEAIAAEVGLLEPVQNGERDPVARALVVSGEELQSMSQAALRYVLRSDLPMFARTSPLDKLRIVETLQGMKNVVAVTGDGVNDAPALKRADVGVAMGKSGTDVAREAADVVLYDDNFASIVSAVEEGRIIYANIRRFIGYVLTSNIPEILPYIAFVLFNIPLPLPVLLILAIDLGTDLAPAIALASEPAEDDVMKQPPRLRSERLLSFSLLSKSYLGWGPYETLAGFIAYFFVLESGGWSFGQQLNASDPIYREGVAAFFAAIVLCQVANVLNWRTSKQSLLSKGLMTNRSVLLGISIEVFLLFLIVATPIGNKVFNTLPPSGAVWLLCVPFAVTMLIFAESVKCWRRSLVQKS